MNDLKQQFIKAFNEKPGSGSRAKLLKKCMETGENFFELYLNFQKSDSRQITLFETIAGNKKTSDKANPLTWETLA